MVMKTEEAWAPSYSSNATLLEFRAPGMFHIEDRNAKTS
mgnify:CR=1 FL=1